MQRENCIPRPTITAPSGANQKEKQKMKLKIFKSQGKSFVVPVTQKALFAHCVGSDCIERGKFTRGGYEDVIFAHGVMCISIDSTMRQPKQTKAQANKRK